VGASRRVGAGIGLWGGGSSDRSEREGMDAGLVRARVIGLSLLTSINFPS
jgi:hypothetical protein